MSVSATRASRFDFALSTHSGFAAGLSLSAADMLFLREAFADPLLPWAEIAALFVVDAALVCACTIPIGIVLGALAGAVRSGPAKPWRSKVTGPLGICTLLLFACALCYVNATAYVGLYPMPHAALALATAVSLIAAAKLLLSRFRQSGEGCGRRARLAVNAAATALWLCGLVLLPSEIGQTSRVLLGSSVHAAHARSLAWAVTDFDRDGFSSAVTGGDCDGLDPGVCPGAVDVPDDGIDQDCLGGDATSAAIAALQAPRRASYGSPFLPVPTRGGNQGTGRPVTILSGERPVIVLSIDALRADRADLMSSYVRMRKIGVTFERAYAPYPSTILSFYSMMTGRMPSAAVTTRYVKWDVPSEDRSQTLPETLAANGYESAGFFFHHVFAPDLGLTRGFDEVWTDSGEASVVVWGEASEKTADLALAWLARNAESSGGRLRPFLLWIHFYDPHEPYIRHEGFEVLEDAGLEDLYEAEIRYTDRHVGRVLDYIESSGLLDRCIVVFTADHGEALGERGAAFHASSLHEEQVRVPLVISGPGVERSVVRDAPVSLAGISDTLCDVLGLPGPRDSTASSFAALLHASRADGRSAADSAGYVAAPTMSGAPLPGSAAAPAVPVFLELKLRSGWTRAVVSWPWKLTVHPGNAAFQLFDLSRDPYERLNVFDVLPDVAWSMESLLTNMAAAVDTGHD